MKVRLSILLLVFSCLFGITSFAGTLYSDDKGLRCLDDNGNAVYGWYRDAASGSWYYFDADGYAHHEWLTDDGLTYYLRPEDGTMIADCTTSISGGYGALRQRALRIDFRTGIPDGCWTV